jgi:hypothetical protein
MAPAPIVRLDPHLLVVGSHGPARAAIPAVRPEGRQHRTAQLSGRDTRPGVIRAERRQETAPNGSSLVVTRRKTSRG